MNGKTLALLYRTVQENNILPITTVCNVRCAFCSHNQNPPEVQAIVIPHLDFDMITDLLDYLDGERKIVIGESTSLIMEGEPFTHPRFFDVLEAIRKKFPHTVIQVTTNGTWLTEENMIHLKALEPLELIVSLNAATPEKRRQLMADVRADVACAAPPLLQQHNLHYHGSIVAMPHLTGWEELTKTVQYLYRNGARTIRLFQPGYTRLTKSELIPPANVFERLQQQTMEWQRLGIPVTLEPKPLHDLHAVVEGVIADSPAADIGLQYGDVITAIDGAKPFSRVDAFAALKQNGTHTLQWRRDGEKMHSTIHITDAFSGLVMYYDLPQSSIRELEQIAADGRQYVMLCSAYAASVWQAADTPDHVTIVPVKSRYFGGNIGAAGLLTITDFEAALAEYAQPYDAVLLPAIAFNDQDTDLTGRNLYDWVEQLNIEVILM